MNDNAHIRSLTLKFLQAQGIMALATVSSGGDPQVAAMNYAVDSDFNFFFATGRETRKFQNILKNSRVSFAVGFGPEVMTVQGGGTTEWIMKAEKDSLKTFAKSLDIINTLT